MNILDLLLGKGLRVSLSDLLLSSLDLVSISLLIAAASAAALGSADLTARETLTIELETPAFGTGALVGGFLGSGDNLGQGFFDDYISCSCESVC